MKKNQVVKMKTGFIIMLAFGIKLCLYSQMLAPTLTITSVTQMEPMIMFDSTDFNITITATDSIGAPDTVSGDLFYYYQTDSMINAGTPPRIINNDPASVLIAFSFNDTLTIDIRPDEIRTTPVNLIILWPAMLNPMIADSVCDSIEVELMGFLGLRPLAGKETQPVIFPCPALQYIYIQPEQLGQITEINLFTITGEFLSHYAPEDFRLGLIDIGHLAPGYYLVEVYYPNRLPRQIKIQKLEE